MNYNKHYNKNTDKKIENNIIKNLKNKSKKPSYISHVFSKDVYINSKKKSGGFQDYSINIDNNKLTNRIKNYILLRKKLSLLNVNDCLETKNFNRGVGYTIRNIINLEKKIGSDSKNGTIYLTSIPNFNITYPIATKIMKNNKYNKNEINIMISIVNNILLKKLSKHFLMIYGYCICEKSIESRLQIISINELASGDLRDLTAVKDVLQDDELMLNLLFQTFISIATFHNKVGYVHNDTHYGNFLYQENNEVGYYHYIFNGKNYYLKSCKFNIIIYDYGYAKKINNITDNNNTNYDIVEEIKFKIYKDYNKITSAFINKKYKGWVDYSDLPNNTINNIIMDINYFLKKNISIEINHSKYSENNRQYSLKLFANIIEYIFLRYTPKGMFITVRPQNVINTPPFIIG
jgi:hypothetical protein